MNFLKKLFGVSTKTKEETLIEEALQTLIDKAGFKLSFDIKASDDGSKVLFDLYGEDENLVIDKEGLLLDQIQLFLRRVLQNKSSDSKVSIIVDCDEFRERADESLVTLAEKLKGIALKKKKPVYFRALPPRERKIVHQYLSEDDRIKSKSVGDGLYKKIKVFPANFKPTRSKNNNNRNNTNNNNHSDKTRSDSNSEPVKQVSEETVSNQT